MNGGHDVDVIEWMPPALHAGITSVDPATMTVQTGFETYRAADLVNVVPRQTAGEIAIAADLLGTPAPETEYRSRCWSLIGTDDSVMVGGRYRATADRIAQSESEISGLGDSVATRRSNYDDSAGWYAGLTAELFG